MKTITVRELQDDVYRGLQAHAAQHGRSIEDEVREILTLIVHPENHLRLGDALAALSSQLGLTNEDVEMLEQRAGLTLPPR